MGLSLTKYRRQLRESQAEEISLDAPSPENGLVPQVAVPKDWNAEFAVLSAEVADAIAELPKSERVVMTALKSGESAREVAVALRVAEGRVSQIKNRAIHRLRIQLGVQCGPSV